MELLLSFVRKGQLHAATAKLSFVSQPLLQHWMVYWSSMGSIVMSIIEYYDNNSMYIKAI